MMNIQVVMMKQDDPRKCSAAKLVKFRLAKPVKKTTSRTLVLDPFSKKTLLKSDKKLVILLQELIARGILLFQYFKNHLLVSQENFHHY